MINAVSKTLSGVIQKMRSEYANPIHYYLKLGDQEIFLNDQLGRSITLEFSGQYTCLQCQRSMTKSFQQGYCYPCYRRLLECHMCLLHPERCLAEEGHCSRDDWAHAHCDVPHIVYLANSSDLKIGITRTTQQPTRWIDQGAVSALPLFEVGNRYRAGQVELLFKQLINDKTAWQRMLKNELVTVDLEAKRAELLDQLTMPLKNLRDRLKEPLVPLEVKPYYFDYPVLSYPTKIRSLSLNKQPVITGVIQGMKGQYLYLDHGVINIRQHGGMISRVKID
jgi:hypothetical protein